MTTWASPEGPGPLAALKNMTFFVFIFHLKTFFGRLVHWHAKLSLYTRERQIFHLRILLHSVQRAFQLRAAFYQCIGGHGPRRKGLYREIFRRQGTAERLHDSTLGPRQPLNCLVYRDKIEVFLCILIKIRNQGRLGRLHLCHFNGNGNGSTKLPITEKRKLKHIAFEYESVDKQFLPQ